MFREFNNDTMIGLNILMMLVIAALTFGFQALFFVALVLAPLFILGLVMIARGDIM